MDSLAWNIGLLVVLLLGAAYGIFQREWRANFVAAAVGLFLIIMVIVGKR